MAKEKATVTLYREKVDEARSLVRASSTSEVIDIALDRLIHIERLRRDVSGYRNVPVGEDELAIAAFGEDIGLDDDTDWAAICGEDQA